MNYKDYDFDWVNANVYYNDNDDPTMEKLMTKYTNRFSVSDNSVDDDVILGETIYTPTSSLYSFINRPNTMEGFVVTMYSDNGTDESLEHIRDPSRMYGELLCFDVIHKTRRSDLIQPIVFDKFNPDLFGKTIVEQYIKGNQIAENENVIKLCVSLLDVWYHHSKFSLTIPIVKSVAETYIFNSQLPILVGITHGFFQIP